MDLPKTSLHNEFEFSGENNSLVISVTYTPGGSRCPGPGRPGYVPCRADKHPAVKHSGKVRGSHVTWPSFFS